MQRFRLTLCGFSALLLAALPFAAAAQEKAAASGDAAAVIKRAQELYRNLRSFQLERTTTIQESREGEKPKQVAELKFITATDGAGKLPEGVFLPPLNLDRCRFEIETNGNRFLFVTGEEARWYYSSSANLYKKGEGNLIGAAPLTMVGGLHTFPLTTLEAEAVEDARIVREESIKVDGQERKCHVIEGQARSPDYAALGAKAGAAVEAGKLPDIPPKPKFLGVDFFLIMLQGPGNLGERYFGGRDEMLFYTNQGKPTKVTLWIDPSESLLVRTEMTVVLQKSRVTKEKPTEPHDEEVSVTLTDSFTKIKINEDLPKELFQFAPPAGAKEFQAKREEKQKKE